MDEREQRGRRAGRGRRGSDRSPASRTTAQAEASDFLRAMEGTPDIPDKDAAEPEGEHHPVLRRVRRNERVAIDGELDLHRQPVAVALEALERFLRRRGADGAGPVLVVTGKGHHTPGGVGVLRRAVEEWIAGPGKRWVRAFAEAPRRLGGRGALVVWLKR